MCKFCEAYELARRIDRSDLGVNYRHEYTVALVTRSWKKDRGKKTASRLTNYRNKGLGYKLNYCPECGRELRRRRNGK